LIWRQCRKIGYAAIPLSRCFFRQAAAGKLFDRRFNRIVVTLIKAYPDFRLLHWLKALISYAFCHGRLTDGVKTAIDMAGKYTGRKEATDMTVSLAEELMRKGKAKGREEGREERKAGRKARQKRWS
jgi:predicted transposase YdaD